ncbi:MAG: polysaccharide deacetylase family protein [Pseudomonadota bacterium]
MTGWLAGATALAGLGFSARYHWWRPRLPGIPILMYHQVTDRLAGTPLPKLRVSPRRFAAQLDHLAAAGYATLTLGQAWAAAQGGSQAGSLGRFVVLTFDDAYLDFYETAWPLLSARGMTATVFVVSGEIGGVNAWDLAKGLPQERLMSAAQIRELAAAGVEFGGHGHRHLALTGLDHLALAEELEACQLGLTGLLGAPVNTFSYPFGLTDARVATATAAAGFGLACSTRPGMLSAADDPLALGRIMIKRADDGLDFRLKISRARSRW